MEQNLNKCLLADYVIYIHNQSFQIAQTHTGVI